MQVTAVPIVFWSLQPVRKLSRKTDPLSSHQAATRTVRFAASHENLIVECVKACRDVDGLSTRQIAEKTGLTIEQVARRITKLVDADILEVVADEHGNDLLRDGCRCFVGAV